MLKVPGRRPADSVAVTGKNGSRRLKSEPWPGDADAARVVAFRLPISQLVRWFKVRYERISCNYHSALLQMPVFGEKRAPVRHGIIGCRILNVHDSLHELLTAARRRVFGHVFVREVLLAAAVGCGVGAVVLFVGTAHLGAYWIAIAAIGTLSARLWIERRKRPSEYDVAQAIDERLKLADTLSTAAYFAAPEASVKVDPSLRELQRARAEQAARTVDLKQALPMRRPATLYPAAVLALLVVGLLLFRVSATGSFDTRASLVEGPLKSFLQPSEKQLRGEKRPGEGDEPANGEDTAKDLDKNRDYAGEPEAQTQESPEDPETADEQKGNQQKGDGKGDAAKAEAPDSQSPPNPQDASEQGKEQDGQQQESMLDKLKDAISDMMGKSKPNGKQQKTAQKGKKGDKQKGDDAEKSDADDKNPGDNADSENHNKGNEMDASGSSAEGQKDDNEHSGVGSQEGDKSARQAEAMKAMGKISELFGKRAESVKGDMMIEVGSTRQQLKTPLAQRGAMRGESGGEIHRDTVPLEYQQFVQRYFDQVRRAPAAAKTGGQPGQ
jgi:hypothetical protein